MGGTVRHELQRWYQPMFRGVYVSKALSAHNLWDRTVRHELQRWYQPMFRGVYVSKALSAHNLWDRTVWLLQARLQKEVEEPSMPFP